MMNIMLAQLGAGGIAWLVFTIGLLWCSFSWWRVHRCKLALASTLAALGTCIGSVIMIGVSVFLSFSFRGPSSGIDTELAGQLFLGFFILITIGWMASALLFLLAAKRLKSNPEDLFTPPTTQTSP